MKNEFVNPFASTDTPVFKLNRSNPRIADLRSDIQNGYNTLPQVFGQYVCRAALNESIENEVADEFYAEAIQLNDLADKLLLLDRIEQTARKKASN